MSLILASMSHANVFRLGATHAKSSLDLSAGRSVQYSRSHRVSRERGSYKRPVSTQPANGSLCCTKTCSSVGTLIQWNRIRSPDRLLGNLSAADGGFLCRPHTLFTKARLPTSLVKLMATNVFVAFPTPYSGCMSTSCTLLSSWSCLHVMASLSFARTDLQTAPPRSRG
uniref:Uncharacterized protein n=1 Tax=Spodoptera frugiperda ascovirus 1a TaxID=113370 RepID=Q9DKM2_SFAVA|nr:hypothetical protein [Spodoptera frugiperda ascovirus 1a]